MQITYTGPFVEGVQVLGVEDDFLPGVPRECPDHIAKGLLEQVDMWQKATAKAAVKTEKTEKTGA